MGTKLTQERLKEVLNYDPDTGVFVWVGARGGKAAGQAAGCLTKQGHVFIGVDDGVYTGSKLAWLWVTGVWPSKPVHHENKVSSDNRFSNLYMLGSKVPLRAKPLTAARLREVLSYDKGTGMFTRLAGTSSSRHLIGESLGAPHARCKYSTIMVDGVRYQAHRLAWLHVKGRWPVMYLDHINRDRYDNRIANLRECTNGENLQNMRMKRTNKTGHIGVCFGEAKGTFKAQIGHGGKREHLGTFYSLESASAAYLDAKRRYHTFHPEPITETPARTQ